MIKAVFFDLDNTIYDYELCNDMAERALFEYLKNTFFIDISKAGEYLAMAKEAVKSQLGDVASSHNRLLYMQHICELLNVKPGRYAMDLYNTYWDAFLDNMIIFPDMKELINKLRISGISIGLLTDLTAHIQYRKLIKLEIADCFDYIITSEEAGHDKPDDSMFDLIVKKSGCAKEEVLVVGDDEKKDYYAAINHGFNSVRYTGQNSIKEIEEMIWK